MLLHKIKELCAARGMTIVELERQAGLRRATVNNWGNSVPSADKLYRVAKVLGVTVEALLED